jgi:hypothetical protein
MMAAIKSQNPADTNQLPTIGSEAEWQPNVKDKENSDSRYKSICSQSMWYTINPEREGDH